jgi:hypothetical protein
VSPAWKGRQVVGRAVFDFYEKNGEINHVVAISHDLRNCKYSNQLNNRQPKPTNDNDNIMMIMAPCANIMVTSEIED